MRVMRMMMTTMPRMECATENEADEKRKRTTARCRPLAASAGRTMGPQKFWAMPALPGAG